MNKYDWSELEDTDKHMIREYKSWAVSDCNIALRLAEMDKLYKRIAERGLLCFITNHIID